jgi:hypothetical protein
MSEDYLIRHIAMLRQLIRQALGLREEGHFTQALRISMQGLEQLFARPLVDFTHLDIEEQLALLSFQETQENAREKHLGYALLLREAGLCYWELERRDLAFSAFELALHVSLRTAALDEKKDEELGELIVELVSKLPQDSLHAPTRELLALWEKKNAPGSEI